MTRVWITFFALLGAIGMMFFATIEEFKLGFWVSFICLVVSTTVLVLDE